jgi:hypothetical protein
LGRGPFITWFTEFHESLPIFGIFITRFWSIKLPRLGLRYIIEG